MPRLDSPDDYVLDAALVEYRSAPDGRARVELLKRWNGPFGLPEAIARVAVKDADPFVRMWLARNVDWREAPRELLAALLTDAEPVVRAAYWESRHHAGGGWVECFKEASKLDRLAMMRSPSVGADLVLRVFDVADDSLRLEGAERAQLITAFFANPLLDELRNNRRNVLLLDENLPEKLWELALAWSGMYLDLRRSLFACVPAQDAMKERAYAATEDHWEHQAIIAGCSAEDTRTLLRAAEEAKTVERYTCGGCESEKVAACVSRLDEDRRLAEGIRATRAARGRYRQFWADTGGSWQYFVARWIVHPGLLCAIIVLTWNLLVAPRLHAPPIAFTTGLAILIALAAFNVRWARRMQHEENQFSWNCYTRLLYARLLWLSEKDGAPPRRRRSDQDVTNDHDIELSRRIDRELKYRFVKAGDEDLREFWERQHEPNPIPPGSLGYVVENWLFADGLALGAILVLHWAEVWWSRLF